MRICFFSFYDNEGVVDKYIFFILRELRKLCDKICFVANGFLDAESEKEIRKIVQLVYLRNNYGYDAGAYKYLFTQIGWDEVSKYDELILCNDTFFGPMVPLSDLFKKMESSDADFWGINHHIDAIDSHVQSFLLVFRKPILESKSLEKFFNKYIDENTSSVEMVYILFERGLYDYLAEECGFKGGINASENESDIYECSLDVLMEHNIPIVKKKIFSNPVRNKGIIDRTLAYVKYHTSYDVNIILDYIKRAYDVHIDYKDIKPLEYYPEVPEVKRPYAIVGLKEIIDFVGDDEFYIYGNKYYALSTWWRLFRDSDKFLGFVISDGQEKGDEEIFGKPIFYFSEAPNINNTKVIIGVCATKYVEEIISNFDNKDNLLRIY